MSDQNSQNTSPEKSKNLEKSDEQENNKENNEENNSEKAENISNSEYNLENKENFGTNNEGENKNDEKPNKLKEHEIPTEPCWHITRSKTGFTLPKEIRDNIIPYKQDCALVVKDNKLIFYMINPEDKQKLKLVKESRKLRNLKNKKKGRQKNSIPEGPQPEWGSYFLFEFENNNKIQEVLTTAFEKFATEPPNLEEGMNIVKYSLVSFLTTRMNNARLRQAIIFFLCDVIEKFGQPNLIDFINEKIVGEIKSKFLYQLSLNQLAFTAFKVKRYEKAQEFIELCIKDIKKYNQSEMYAIMDSFKNCVVKLTKDIDFLIPQEYLLPIRNSLREYLDIMDDSDYKLQIVDLLARMQFIDEANNIAEDILKKLPEESPSRDEVKDLIKRLATKSV
ncbi:MAG: hypothetical protein ACTSWY_04950 [Promethearchaeota archaeon]